MAHGALINTDPLLQVVKSTRSVSVPSACRVIGTVGDHNSEMIGFQCPRFIDEHDVSQCRGHYISWVNADGSSGRYEVTQMESDEETFYFAWLVGSGVTASAGNIQFSIHFIDYDDEGKINYRWSTAVNDQLEIVESVNSDIDDDDYILEIDVDTQAILEAVEAAVGGVLA